MTVGAARAKSALAQRLQGLSAEEQRELLVGLVAAQVAVVLGRPSGADIDAGTAFQDLGFDSLTAIELRNRLKSVTGLVLSPTLIFDYPTPVRLAEYLGEQLGGVVAPVRALVSARVGVDEPVAIVGMGCRFPGGVDSAAGLWEVVVEGPGCDLGVPVGSGLGRGGVV